MGATSIEWTDHSINPFRAKLNGRVGHYCEKVSQGCKNCYSSRMQRRFGMPSFAEQRNADVEHLLDASKLEDVLRRRTPTKWFWCDMTDMFGAWVPFEWIAACFGVMAATLHHTHQVLTKRPERAIEFYGWLDERARANDSTPLDLCVAHASQQTGKPSPEFMPEWRADDPPWPLANVHLGVSCENQATADERAPLLLQCPASVRWVSAEPLLGPIEFNGNGRHLLGTASQARGMNDGIDWIVVGGESGPGARPLDLSWIRSIVQQCADVDVPCFVKQFGRLVVDSDREAGSFTPHDKRSIAAANTLGCADNHPNLVVLANRKGNDLSKVPGNWPREFPAGA
jgi:protein gp37